MAIKLGTSSSIAAGVDDERPLVNTKEEIPAPGTQITTSPSIHRRASSTSERLVREKFAQATLSKKDICAIDVSDDEVSTEEDEPEIKDLPQQIKQIATTQKEAIAIFSSRIATFREIINSQFRGEMLKSEIRDSCEGDLREKLQALLKSLQEIFPVKETGQNANVFLLLKNSFPKEFEDSFYDKILKDYFFIMEGLGKDQMKILADFESLFSELGGKTEEKMSFADRLDNHLSEMEGKLEQSTVKIKELEKTSAAKLDENSNLHTKNDKLTQKVTAQNRRIQELEHMLAKAEEEKKNQQRQVSRVTEEKNRIEADAKKAQSKDAATISDLTARLAQSTQSVPSTSSKKAGKKGGVTASDKNVRELEEKLALLGSENASLIAKLADADLARSDAELARENLLATYQNKYRGAVLGKIRSTLGNALEAINKGAVSSEHKVEDAQLSQLADVIVKELSETEEKAQTELNASPNGQLWNAISKKTSEKIILSAITLSQEPRKADTILEMITMLDRSQTKLDLVSNMQYLMGCIKSLEIPNSKEIKREGLQLVRQIVESLVEVSEGLHFIKIGEAAESHSIEENEKKIFDEFGRKLIAALNRIEILEKSRKQKTQGFGVVLDALNAANDLLKKDAG